jgi:hypothetical protein
MASATAGRGTGSASTLALILPSYVAFALPWRQGAYSGSFGAQRSRRAGVHSILSLSHAGTFLAMKPIPSSADTIHFSALAFFGDGVL